MVLPESTGRLSTIRDTIACQVTGWRARPAGAPHFPNTGCSFQQAYEGLTLELTAAARNQDQGRDYYGHLVYHSQVQQLRSLT